MSVMKKNQLKVMIFLFLSSAFVVWVLLSSVFRGTKKPVDTVENDVKFILQVPDDHTQWPNETQVIIALTRIQQAGRHQESVSFAKKWTEHPSSAVRAKMGRVLASRLGSEDDEDDLVIKLLRDEVQEVRVGVILGLQESLSLRASQMALQQLPLAQNPWEILTLLGVAVRMRDDESTKNEKFMKQHFDRVGLEKILENAHLKSALINAIEIAYANKRIENDFYQTYKKLLSTKL
jgi:hypothetical protein